MRNERGSATLVVLTLAAVLAAMVVANGRMIDALQRELRRIDQQQQQRFQQGHGQNPGH